LHVLERSIAELFWREQLARPPHVKLPSHRVALVRPETKFHLSRIHFINSKSSPIRRAKTMQELDAADSAFFIFGLREHARRAISAVRVAGDKAREDSCLTGVATDSELHRSAKIETSFTARIIQCSKGARGLIGAASDRRMDANRDACDWPTR
jgi:hypothetical protein